MYCLKCGALEDKVIDSRLAKDGKSIRRRRECEGCGFRYTTYEVIEQVELRVVKKDGSSEPFDRGKVLGGMLKACEKRPVPAQVLEVAVEEIYQELANHFDRDVPTQVVGAKVMEHLHALDGVAYVRYASVYRRFQDVGEFIEEIQSFGRRAKRSAQQPELFDQR
jgi:transcriptional repressor NrdR